jgi:hypothetical protein
VASVVAAASAGCREGTAPAGLRSERRTPQAGESWSLPFEPREAWELRLPLRRGWFLHLAVHQHGVDVVPRLLGPEGRTLFEVDTATGAESTEELIVLVAGDGDHRLRLEPGKRDASGSVDVEVLAYRPAEASDPLRTAAAGAMARGHRAWIAGDAPETESAFREALPLLVELRDRERETEARHMLGLALESREGLEEAAQELAAAQEGYRETNWAADEALASNQLGRVLRRLGRSVAAEAAYRRALAVV